MTQDAPLHTSDPHVGRRFQGRHGEQSVLSRHGDRYLLSIPGSTLTTVIPASQLDRHIEVEEGWARSAQARQQQRDTEAAAAEAETWLPYRVFAAGFPTLRCANVRRTLETPMRRHGQVLPRHALTEGLLSEGGVLNADRTRLDMPGGSFFTPDVLTKTAFDYAGWLSDTVTVWRLERGGTGPVSGASRPDAPGVCQAVRDHLAHTGLPTVHDIAGDRSAHWHSGCLSKPDLQRYFSAFWDDLRLAGYDTTRYLVPRRALRFAAGEVAYDARLARCA
ncbi:hypothetical protein [Deinococcus ficus]|uniref:Uncharacterized protein n=1 Tax=Deinococcus ficus TaxID=317577 RepID=A0A221T2I9_9DEIO|nr:hypothetical protein [Deinococcus ficus]ASN83137.1 hypothetical protein DFI_18220 [Deinococcus ficus]